MIYSWTDFFKLSTNLFRTRSQRRARGYFQGGGILSLRRASLQPNIIQVLMLVKHRLRLGHSALNKRICSLAQISTLLYFQCFDGRFMAYNGRLLLYPYRRPSGNALTGTGTAAPYPSVARQLTAVYHNGTVRSPSKLMCRSQIQVT